MQPSSLWERLSPEQQDDFAGGLLNQYFERLGTVAQNLDTWSIDPTSQLAEDNAASALFRQMSFELHYLVTNSLEHLSVVQSFWNRGSVPPLTPFTLIRSAIESSAYGVWLQEAGTLSARLIRLLELQWDQRLKVDTYTKAAGTHTKALTDWLEAVLIDTKDRRPNLRQRTINGLPTLTDLLIKTDRIVTPNAMIGGSLRGACARESCTAISTSPLACVVKLRCCSRTEPR
ncbi:hypothetical protein [Homoserinibacter gongjuensis]|uniref:Uncharacterized protein n=1 Tax=Homoserinibacter gongjuensis TaxID=1162968 RepID=A0ABQ6JNH5_9MICO|nr:hypothetical protein [Homoserinibacter gongjuensis]GMA89618.1 hypothetical protein GCM10025869_01470 [Homoserinibacter gongjuensis]